MATGWAERIAALEARVDALEAHVPRETLGSVMADLASESPAELVLDATPFDTFYGPYPKKKQRVAAEKAWKKLTPVEQVNAVADVKDRAKKDPDWLKDEGQFVPNPATYLNGKGWQDEWKPQGRKRQSPSYEYEEYKRPHRFQEPTARPQRLKEMLKQSLQPLPGESDEEIRRQAQVAAATRRMEE